MAKNVAYPRRIRLLHTFSNTNAFLFTDEISHFYILRKSANEQILIQLGRGDRLLQKNVYICSQHFRFAGYTWYSIQSLAITLSQDNLSVIFKKSKFVNVLLKVQNKDENGLTSNSSDSKFNAN